MRAAVCYEANQIVVEDLDDPVPGPGEIRIRIRAVGVCHTDLHMFEGTAPIPFPIVLGHEGAGVVDQVGPGVRDFVVGDHVVCSIIGSCGQCYWCLHDDEPYCQETVLLTGRMLDGTTRLSKGGAPIHTLHYQGSFAEMAVVPERFATKVRDDAPLDVVCGLACGASTGLGAALVRADVQRGSSVVVVGSGGVGLSAMLGAQLAGATTVIAVDVLPQKLDTARRIGAATHTVDASTQDVLAAVHALTEGRGADYGFDAVGLPPSGDRPGTLDTVVKAVRKGGTCVVIGRAGSVGITLDTSQLLQGRILTGTFGGSISPRRHIPEFVDLVAQGRLNLGGILDARYRLDDIAQALDDLHHGRVTRGVVVME
jgi:Zn-dependent alcohol dehydrogenase